jgi:hypothetical protein
MSEESLDYRTRVAGGLLLTAFAMWTPLIWQ